MIAVTSFLFMLVIGGPRTLRNAMIHGKILNLGSIITSESRVISSEGVTGNQFHYS